MLTPAEMNLRAQALALKSAAAGGSGAAYGELSQGWRLLAVQSVFFDAMLAALSGPSDPTSPEGLA